MKFNLPVCEGTYSESGMSHHVENGNAPAGDTDREIVARCQRGDAQAFGALVEKYQKKMLNTAYRMIGDYQEACEATQEAFLSAYRGIKKFRGEAAAWADPPRVTSTRWIPACGMAACAAQQG